MEVELKSIDSSIFFSSDPANPDTLAHFHADLQMFSGGNSNPDPGTYLKAWTCNEISQKKNNWSKPNTSRYCNPEYDKLWLQSNTELDSQKRRQLIIQMNDLLIKEQAVIPLISRANVNGVSNRITGIDSTPWDDRTWNIKDWQLK